MDNFDAARNNNVLPVKQLLALIFKVQETPQYTLITIKSFFKTSFKVF